MPPASSRPARGRAHPPADPYAAAREAADALHARLTLSPDVAIVLGTGLGDLANRISEAQRIPYAELVHFPRSTVAGHAGQLVIGRLAGVPVAALQGRFHLYEGYTPAQVVHPVRTLALLGARVLVVTNASGGLDPAYNPGDLMLVRDHIGMPVLAGQSPLMGPNDERVGPRFPAMTAAYDPDLRALARSVAGASDTLLREGVYVMVAGPSYETPAELAYLRRIGGDAVGMSSVPEVIAARHMGQRVLAISCVTNIAYGGEGVTPAAPSHEEVLAAAAGTSARLAELVTGVVARLAASDTGNAPTQHEAG